MCPISVTNNKGVDFQYIIIYKSLLEEKKRKITHLEHENSLSPILTTFIYGWVKDYEKKLACELIFAKDKKSLSILGYKASILHFNLEKSSRKLRFHSQKINRTICTLLDYQNKLHKLFVHPLTGELHHTQSSSILMTFISWCFWKMMSTLRYGETLYPLLYKSCHLISQKAKDEALLKKRN